MALLLISCWLTVFLFAQVTEVNAAFVVPSCRSNAIVRHQQVNKHQQQQTLQATPTSFLADESSTSIFTFLGDSSSSSVTAAVHDSVLSVLPLLLVVVLVGTIMMATHAVLLQNTTTTSDNVSSTLDTEIDLLLDGLIDPKTGRINRQLPHKQRQRLMRDLKNKRKMKKIGMGRRDTILQALGRVTSFAASDVLLGAAATGNVQGAVGGKARVLLPEVRSELDSRPYHHSWQRALEMLVEMSRRLEQSPSVKRGLVSTMKETAVTAVSVAATTATPKNVNSTALSEEDVFDEVDLDATIKNDTDAVTPHTDEISATLDDGEEENVAVFEEANLGATLNKTKVDIDDESPEEIEPTL